MWGEMWQHPSDQVVAGLDECVRLFTESGDEEAAAMATAAKATARMQFPDLDAEAAAAELREAAPTLHELGNTWGEAIAEVVDSDGSRWLRGEARRGAGAFRPRDGRSPRPARTSSRSWSRATLRSRLNFLRGERGRAPRPSSSTLLRLPARLHFEEGMAYGLEGHLRRRRGARRGLARRVRCRRRRRAVRQRSRPVRRRSASLVQAPQLAALREQRPGGSGRRRARRRGADLAEAVALALPDGDDTRCRTLAQR